MLRPTGSVLGVDVGFSPQRATSAVCRLDWDKERVTWSIARFRYDERERETVIAELGGKTRLEAAAFDGPLRRGFDVIGRYRTAERMLTSRLLAKIGKPGQANAPVGKRLNAAANLCAESVRRLCDLAPAVHAHSIDPLAIVEAFPTAFLGLMIADPAALKVRRNNRSDVYFQHLASSGALDRLVAGPLPGRSLARPFASVAHHDDRASLVCALTSLCVASGAFTAVGDDADGWIILPPAGAIEPWALAALEANAGAGPAGCLYRSRLDIST